MQYDWPGNVRELENVVERNLILNPKGPLSFKELISGSISHTSVVVTEEKWETLDVVATRYIKRVLEKTKGKINGPGGAAEILGINPNTLRNRMRKLGIDFGRK